MIPFAIKNNRLVSIEEVPRGLACGCVCPACKAPLIAKKGALNMHHFSHYRGTECPKALETSLHLMAKAVLADIKKIVIPPMYVRGISSPIQKARLLYFSNVKVERYKEGIIPDLLLENGTRKLLVEIAVHHAADWSKIWKLQKFRWHCIEINLRGIYRYLNGLGKGGNKQAFSEMIVHDFQFKHWLFNPRQHALEYRLRKAADKKKVSVRSFFNKQHYLVNRCPVNKRVRRNGPMDGLSYANVFVDCLHCQHCLEIEYQRIHIGYRIIPDKPKYVFCLGKLKKEVEDLRKWLWG